MKLLRWLEARVMRLAAPFDHPRAAVRAGFIVPLLCGLLSLAMGQDDGWDMRNYHLYNVYALFNGRMGVDMSPAGFQSYFNPLLDVPYYALTQAFAGPVAGFVFGALHGLAFVLLAAITRLCVGGGRTALLLAVAGMLSAAFLSELGNSMGDNLTALFVLGSVLMLMRRWEQLGTASGGALRVLLGAGAVMGLGLGLKLTNASFAVGACVALLAITAPLRQRVLAAFVYGVGVLAGMTITAGWWMLHLWQVYGNPLFPQFNNLFHSPMAAEMGVLDTGHLPRTIGEALLWPFVFTRDIRRIAEVPIQQVIWPLLYVIAAAWVVAALLRLVRADAGARALARADGRADAHADARVLGREPALAPRTVFLFVFIGVSYLVWMRLFSIYRYLVPIELLAPLLCWLLLQSLGRPAVMRRVGGYLLLAVALAVLPFTTWGHADWTARAFIAQAPAIAKPAQAVIFQASLDSPMGWLAQFMPPDAAVVGLGSGFPESAAYQARMRQTIATRGGPHYIMFPITVDQRAIGMVRKSQIATSLGLTGSEAGCRRLTWLAGHVRMKAQVEALAPPSGQLCTLALQPQYRQDTAPADRTMEAEAARRLRLIGLGYDPASCVAYQAAVGSAPYPYRMCVVTAAAR